MLRLCSLLWQNMFCLIPVWAKWLFCLNPFCLLLASQFTREVDLLDEKTSGWWALITREPIIIWNKPSNLWSHIYRGRPADPISRQFYYQCPWWVECNKLKWSWSWHVNHLQWHHLQIYIVNDKDQNQPVNYQKSISFQEHHQWSRSLIFDLNIDLWSRYWSFI